MNIPPNMPSFTMASLEGNINCNECSNGQYLISQCSDSIDRICATCTEQCYDGAFMYQACSKTEDTRCKVCGTCPMGMYVKAACNSSGDLGVLGVLGGLGGLGAENDIECAACTQCGRGMYETKTCANGEDAMCETCQQVCIDEASIHCHVCICR